MSSKREFGVREMNKISRRDVIKLAGILPFGAYFCPRETWSKPGSMLGTKAIADKTLRLGIIGFGIRGEQLVRATGFPTAEWKERMKNTPAYEQYVREEKLGVVFTGVCDLYDARAERALGAVGKSARRYKRYQDLLASKDIDAILIATPDHLHASMIIDAARAGKHVYVEKCMTHNLEEVGLVYEAVKRSGITFQLGHQLRQKDSFIQARDLLHMDILGKTTLVQTSSNRNSPNAAWVYDIPADASSENIDWKQFDQTRAFDADRFFRWRKYWDYGTGLSGDLLTHEFDSMNFIMGMGIPHSAMASGGVYFYQDGREVPDVFQVAFEFPEKKFTMLYSATLANDNQRPTLIMGHDATMHLGNTIEVWANPGSTKYKDKLMSGIMSTDKPFYLYPSKENSVKVDAVTSATSQYFAKKGMMSTFKDGEAVDPTRLHIQEWLLCIENRWKPTCDIEAGYEEAIAAHMATLSYKSGKKVFWNKEKRTVVFE